MWYLAQLFCTKINKMLSQNKKLLKNKIELLYCLFTISVFSVHKWFDFVSKWWVVLLNLEHYLLWNPSAHLPACCWLYNRHCICLIFWTHIFVLWTTQRFTVLSNKTRQKILCFTPDSGNVLKVRPCEWSSRATEGCDLEKSEGSCTLCWCGGSTSRI